MLTITDENYHAIVRKLIADKREVQRGNNLQNLPAKGDGKLVRKCFIPRDGYIFVGADLGQIEPRIMAHIMYVRYGDNSMRQIFVDNVDLYTTMAMMTFNLAESYCVDKALDPTGTFAPRALMKTGVLAVAYRQSAKSFAKKMNVSSDVAAFFFENFDQTFPSFKTMVNDIIGFMRKNGYVETLFGRKRRFPDYSSVAAEASKNEERLIRLYTERKRLNARAIKTEADFKRLDELEVQITVLADSRGMIGYWERAAFNAVIQGSGADVLKLNGIKNAEVCRERGWYMPASIHDELKDEIPIDDLTPDTIALIDDIMTKTVSLSVPLVTDIVIERRWMEEVKPENWDFERQQPKEAA